MHGEYFFNNYIHISSIVFKDSWCPENLQSGEYIQIDLGQKTRIAGIATQGSAFVEERITWYKIQFSVDSDKVMRDYNNGRELEGNLDGKAIERHDLVSPIEARYIRIVPTKWLNYIALRLELYACKKRYSAYNISLLSGIIKRN